MELKDRKETEIEKLFHKPIIVSKGDMDIFEKKTKKIRDKLKLIYLKIK